MQPSQRSPDARLVELSNRLNGQYLSDKPESLTQGENINFNEFVACNSTLCESNGDYHLQQQEQSSPNTHLSYEQPFTPNVTQVTTTKLEVAEKKMDIVWLLNALRPDGDATREEKKETISALKKLAKTSTEEFWRVNSAQIISVLLEAFNPTVLTKTKRAPTEQKLTGLTPPQMQSSTIVEQSRDGMEKQNPAVMEAMHVACKGLLIMVKVHGGRYMEVRMNVRANFLYLCFLHLFLCCKISRF